MYVPGTMSYVPPCIVIGLVCPSVQLSICIFSQEPPMLVVVNNKFGNSNNVYNENGNNSLTCIQCYYYSRYFYIVG